MFVFEFTGDKNTISSESRKFSSSYATVGASRIRWRSRVSTAGSGHFTDAFDRSDEKKQIRKKADVVLFQQKGRI
jgi:hypothetical protein